MERPEVILQNLSHFNGSEQFFKHGITGFCYTEGVNYLCESCESFWLIDFIFSHQSLKNVAVEVFQVWKVYKNEDKWEVVCEDGNDHLVFKNRIEYSDFPLDETILWLVNNSVLMLPSEY